MMSMMIWTLVLVDLNVRSRHLKFLGRSKHGNWPDYWKDLPWKFIREYEIIKSMGNCNRLSHRPKSAQTLEVAISYRKSGCLSVVCDVRAPYSAGRNFWQCFYAILYPSHPRTFMQTFTSGVKRKRGSQISLLEMSKAVSLKRCKIRPGVQLMSNRKSYP